MKILNQILFPGAQALKLKEKIPLMQQWEIDDVDELGISSSRGEMLILKDRNRLVKTGIFKIRSNSDDLFGRMLKSLNSSPVKIKEALIGYSIQGVKPYWLIGKVKTIKEKYKKEIKKYGLKVLDYKSDKTIMAPAASDLGIFITMCSIIEVVDKESNKSIETYDNASIYGTYIVKNPTSNLVSIE